MNIQNDEVDVGQNVSLHAVYVSDYTLYSQFPRILLIHLGISY